MTTQTQGKGKRKGKEQNKVPLDVFNQIDAPDGHSVVNLKLTGIDWAEAMAVHDQQAPDTQQIIVPTAPRAQRGPAVDYESLPNAPPFRVSLFNLQLSFEQKDVERLFGKLDVKSVDISKTSTTVEFGNKDDLFEALSKDGSNIKGKNISVCLYGQTPQNNYNSDRYGGRGNSFGDRYNDRGQGSNFGSRNNDRFGDRSGGFNRDREGGFSSGFNRGGPGQSRGGPGERFRDNYRENNRGQFNSTPNEGGVHMSEESTNWREKPAAAMRPTSPPSYNNGSRQSYSRPEPNYRNNPPQASSYQSHQQHQRPQEYPNEPYHPPSRAQHHSQASNNSPYTQSDSQSSSNDNINAYRAPSSNEERPRLVLQKRKAPLNVDDITSVPRNEAIFGKAIPSSKPYEKLMEVEQKLSAVSISDKKEDAKEPKQPAGPTPKTQEQSSAPTDSAPSQQSLQANP